MNDDFFYKRFSVGLALDSSAEEYEDLFNQYSGYIDNLYFSPPCGDSFHGRTKIAEQFHDPKMTDRFWQILNVAAKHDIRLEVVFNTHLLDAESIQNAAELFNKKDIFLDKICVQDQYLDIVQDIFPDSKMVHSVNCMPNDREKIIHDASKYDEYVVGRQYTRDTDLFRKISESGTDCVLLLNNGCSHICGGCATQKHCHDSYLKSRESFTSEEIYAFQSIMPYEIDENWLDTSNVLLFKLSTRNADVRYIRMCLDSYIHNDAEEYIKAGKEYYLLWSRLLWLAQDFNGFDYSNIKAIKGKYYYG